MSDHTSLDNTNAFSLHLGKKPSASPLPTEIGQANYLCDFLYILLSVIPVALVFLQFLQLHKLLPVEGLSGCHFLSFFIQLFLWLALFTFQVGT